MLTRRRLLTTASAGTALLGGSVLLPFAARAEGDMFDTPHGPVVIHPVSHASFAMETPAGVLYSDPVGDPALYADLPKPDVILVTHEHGDHYNADTLAALLGDETLLITNPAVGGMLPEALKARATVLANGESTTAIGIGIDAIPAYNTTEDRLKYHPQGRDNGYVLHLGGDKVYIAGDTEDIPEMRALTGIMIAFVPMNLPYTMDTDQAASAVNDFKPQYVYPYHYKGLDPEDFAAKVTDSEVRFGPWYG
ncbi:MBL fold metallo-hydrolase [Frigidibacter sp. ROC022]|uniref:MBL fold metallo-hydrolase n=1 Tax=Frigidibacter sp. ROC022 TaxID=2971796 RepID=UPI00215B2487|nr:MBL fold metallo-hydrolase [Frigidibacter sp. ROC022]MCR8722999.1 MBL fold metallo-hydrolase [Frigidibacter sp. ROC022]